MARALGHWVEHPPRGEAPLSLQLGAVVPHPARAELQVTASPAADPA